MRLSNPFREFFRTISTESTPLHMGCGVLDLEFMWYNFPSRCCGATHFLQYSRHNAIMKILIFPIFSTVELWYIKKKGWDILYNRNSLIALLLTSFVVISGCGGSNNTTTSLGKDTVKQTSIPAKPTVVPSPIIEEAKVENGVVPEPLRLAGEQLNLGNIDRAKTYLDLTISDFEGTDSAFTASIIKSTILASECQSYSYILNSLAKGIDNIASSLVKKEEIHRLQTVLSEYHEREQQLLEEFKKSTEFILSGYKEHLEDQLDGVAFSSVVISPSKDLSFFEDVGYPIPTDSEIDDVRQHALEQLLYGNLKDGFENNSLNYVNYFYLAGLNLIKLGESDYTESVMREVIALTEDDKYNEKRIDVQEYLNK